MRLLHGLAHVVGVETAGEQDVLRWKHFLGTHGQFPGESMPAAAVGAWVVGIKQDGAALMMLEAGAKLADVVKALNSLGATAQDLIAILQALKAAGSLKAELEII